MDSISPLVTLALGQLRSLSPTHVVRSLAEAEPAKVAMAVAPLAIAPFVYYAYKARMVTPLYINIHCISHL